METCLPSLARRASDVTLEPDGTAAACKAAWSGFDSHRRLLKASDFVAGQRRAESRFSSLLGVFRTWNLTMAAKGAVSSEVEHQTANLEVAGSTPVPTPTG